MMLTLPGPSAWCMWPFEGGRRNTLLPCLVLLLVLGGGCGSPPEDPEHQREVDQSLSDQESEGPETTRWHVSETPFVVLGQGATPDDPPLHRVHGAFRRSDGGVTLAHGENVHVYDVSGRLIHRSAGYGEGPGEVLAPTRFIRMPGDSSFFWDDRLGPAQVFGPSGDHVRTQRVSPELLAGLREAAAPECVAGSPFPLADLTLLQVVAACGSPWDRDRSAGELFSSEFSFLRTTEGGGVLEGGVELRGERQTWQMVDGAPVGSRVGAAVTMPLSPSWLRQGIAHSEAMVTAAPGSGDVELLLADGWSPEVYIWGPSGISIVEMEGLPAAPPPPSHAEWEQSVQSTLPPEAATGGELPPAVLERHEARMEVWRSMPPPSEVRRFGWMMMDAEGVLWLHGRELGYMAVDMPSGRYIGQIELPASLWDATLLEVGMDYVLARVPGDDGVELVVLHELQRTPEM